MISFHRDLFSNNWTNTPLPYPSVAREIREGVIWPSADLVMYDDFAGFFSPVPFLYIDLAGIGDSLLDPYYFSVFPHFSYHGSDTGIRVPRTFFLKKKMLSK